MARAKANPKRKRNVANKRLQGSRELCLRPPPQTPASQTMIYEKPVSLSSSSSDDDSSGSLPGSTSSTSNSSYSGTSSTTAHSEDTLPLTSLITGQPVVNGQ
eukprot:755564-Amphidinium_carterae.2